jgi:hypothetical protein
MDSEEQQALAAAMRALLGPLARLLVASGVPYAAAEEALKRAMVDAARRAQSGGLPHRIVSRISAATGLNRREVTRLTRDPEPAGVLPPSLASAVFTRWRTAPSYRDGRGRPRALPRQGSAPSFEALSRSITQDVHPRTVLDELVRLGLAVHDSEHDVVTLARDAFVPALDRARMLDFLARNVGDHLDAAVANVLGQAPRHPEQALFVDELSRESIEAAEAWLADRWPRVLGEAVPFLEARSADDAAHPERARNYRLRAGFYGYSETMAPADPSAQDAAPRKRARAAKKTQTRR